MDKLSLENGIWILETDQNITKELPFYYDRETKIAYNKDELLNKKFTTNKEFFKISKLIKVTENK